MSAAKGLPTFSAESPDDGAVEVPSLVDFPSGEFLAIVQTPCPVGRYARGGVGGQMFTSCATCGHASPSTAMQAHVGPMLTPVVAYTSQSHDGPPMIFFRRLNAAELGGDQ